MRSRALLYATPAQVRNDLSDVVIRYTVASTSIGRLAIATTRRGVCLIAFGDSDRQLLDEIVRRFPRATLGRAEKEEHEWMHAVVSLIDNPSMLDTADVPLDVRGTIFQEQVWSTLRQTRSGDTITYSQLASAIGRPTVARAVAAACGANPAAVLIPCHRVVGADGSLTGYRWGVDRKQELLRREANARR